MTNRKTLRARYGAVAAALLPFAALAAQPPVDPLQLDSNLQQLEEQALDINQQAQAVEEDFLYPDSTRVSVYVSVAVPGMLIRDMTVWIDDGAPVRHVYTETEAIVLQDRGMDRVTRLVAQPGRHRIRAQYTAQYSDARPTDPVFAGAYAGTFDKTQQPADLELQLRRDGYLTRPELSFHDWRKGQ
jgi:hypothetical protein